MGRLSFFDKTECRRAPGSQLDSIAPGLIVGLPARLSTMACFGGFAGCRPAPACQLDSIVPGRIVGLPARL